MRTITFSWDEFESIKELILLTLQLRDDGGFGEIRADANPKLDAILFDQDTVTFRLWEPADDLEED